MAQYQIFTDSSCDLDKEQRGQYGIEYFRMLVNVNGKEYHADLDYEEYSPKQLYEWVGDLKNTVKTSLIPVDEYLNKMKPYLDKGIDILYLACTSVLSGSLGLFNLVIQDLKEEYPDRTIIGVDTCRAGLPEGLIVMDAAKMQKEGASMEDVIKFVDENKLKYNLCGTVETLSYLKAAGRVSAASAFFGNLFGVKPIIVADEVGHNLAVAKAKGTKNAYIQLFDFIKSTVEGQEHPVIYVGQGNAEAAAKYFKERFEKELGATVVEYWVGPIIGVSCGPGVIHLVAVGKVANLKKS